MALGKHYVGRGAQNINLGAQRLVQETAHLGQMKIQAALLNNYYDGPQMSAGAKIVSAAISTVTDVAGGSYFISTVDDLCQGTSYGLNSKGSNTGASAYIDYSGGVYCNGYEVTDKKTVAEFHQAHRDIAHIVEGGQPAIERELSRLNCCIRDIELVGQAYASKGHDTGIGTGNGNNNALKFDVMDAMYRPNVPKPNAIGAAAFNI
jgi:hypothetical protein